MTYDPPNVNLLCRLAVDRDTVGFYTSRMTYLSTGDQYSLRFRGVLTRGSLKGTLQMFGPPFDRREFITQLLHYPLDVAAAHSDSDPSGLYVAAHAVSATGDVLGHELLLLNSAGRMIGFYTEIAGAPDGPYPIDTLHIDDGRVAVTVSIDGAMAFRNFILTSGELQGRREALDLEQSDTILLRKVATPAELFARSYATGCPNPGLPGQGAGR